MNVDDPVCNKEINLRDVVAFENHEGWAYFFCSNACHHLFKLSPERFSKKLKAAPVNLASSGIG